MKKLTVAQMNALLDAASSATRSGSVPVRRREALSRAEKKLREGVEQQLKARKRKELGQ